MCVRVPIVRPPKLSDVLFADDEDEEGEQTDGQTEGQTEGPKRKRKRRDSDKFGLRKINADDEIDELDQPLFQESERIFSQANPELSNSKFFEVQVLLFIFFFFFGGGGGFVFF